MELSYPAEAEAFRGEVRAWLEANLPPGWFEPGFRMMGNSILGEDPERSEDESEETVGEGEVRLIQEDVCHHDQLVQ